MRAVALANRRGVSAITTASVATVLIASAAGGIAASSAYDEEDAARELESQAIVAGALGFYSASPTSEFVIVVPSSRAPDFSVPTTALRRQVRVETRPIERANIDAALETLATVAANPEVHLTYLGYYFDPSIGLIRATGDVDPNLVEPRLGDARAFVAYSKGPPAIASSRHTDYAPFWGGDELFAGGGYCTGGFPVKDSSKSYMVTAAHCYQNGAHVYSPGSGLEIGQVVKWRSFLVSSDLELLGNKTYEGRIYTGDLYASSFLPVTGAVDPVTGIYQYCYSGVRSFQKCSYQVTTLDSHQCFYDDNGLLGCADHVMVFRNSAGNAEPQPGDSGAPFYKPVTGAVGARGIVNGSWCPDICYGLGFRWSQIASQLAVSIKTYP